MTATKADPIAAIEDAIHALNSRAHFVERDHLIDVMNDIVALVEAANALVDATAKVDAACRSGIRVMDAVNDALAFEQNLRAALAPFKATQT